MEANHHWERVPIKYTRYDTALCIRSFSVEFEFRELKDLPLVPSPVRPSTPLPEGTADMNEFKLAAT